MGTLKIGSTTRGGDFSLPLDLVTQTVAILAKKGAGKSYTASVMVEGLLDAGQVPVIIDPTGAWWGLKSSADGRSVGYPMVVFGGEHADLTLEENAGEATARAIVEQRFPAIIDLSLFRKGQMKRFLIPFLETLYRLNRLPLTLIVDEADDVCPQRPFGDEAQLVGALEDVVKRGRKKGIGCILITQRPADLAKQVLTQCEMLVALRIVHPLDIKAVMEWVNVHADPKPAAAMVESLPSLPIGTAWFWSPGWGDIFERVQVAKRKTFDSGATPKAGEQAITPKRMAQPDLTKIGSEIMASVQRAKDNDPAQLKARLAAAEREVAMLKVTVANPLVQVSPPERVEVPVLDRVDRGKLDEIRDLLSQSNSCLSHVGVLFDALNGDVTDRVDKIMTIINRPMQAIPQQKTRWREDVSKSTSPRPPGVFHATPTDLPEGEKRILTAVAQHPEGCTREQLTVLTGYKKSSRDTYLQRLRARALIEVGERISATQAGVMALGSDYEPLPTGADLRDYWLQRLPTGEKKVLEVMLRHPRDVVHRDIITASTGYLKSSRDTYIQRLASRELVVVSREGVRASENLF